MWRGRDAVWRTGDATADLLSMSRKTSSFIDHCKKFSKAFWIILSLKCSWKTLLTRHLNGFFKNRTVFEKFQLKEFYCLCVVHCTLCAVSGALAGYLTESLAQSTPKNEKMPAKCCDETAEQKVWAAWLGSKHNSVMDQLSHVCHNLEQLTPLGLAGFYYLGWKGMPEKRRNFRRPIVQRLWYPFGCS